MRRSITSAVLTLALGVALVVAPLGVPAAEASSSLEADFVARMNHERAQRGLHGLSVAGDLVDYGRRHSAKMANESDLHHSGNLRSLDNWDLVGENVGRGGSVDALHRAFMDSTGHRANILRSEFSEVGVGVVVRDGTIWVTVVFRDPTVVSANRTVPDVVGIASTSTGDGYWIAYADGRVGAHGDAPDLGSAAGRTSAPVVSMAATPSNRGYWLLDASGGVFSFGDARYHGSVPELRAAGNPVGRAEVVSIVATASGGGYWILDRDGGVFTFGDARYRGSIPGLRRDGHPVGRAPVIGMAPTGSGEGYWVLDESGGVFTFGDAAFLGSLPGLQQQGEASDGVEGVAVAPTPEGDGYWLLGSTGQVFGFGAAG